MRSKVCSDALTQRVLSTLKTAVRRENGIISMVIRPASTMTWPRVSRYPRGECVRRLGPTLGNVENVVDDGEQAARQA